MRSHYCGQVDEALIGEEISACGWVHRRRDHGGVIFVDLRDREGLLQVVFDPDRPEIFAEAERIRGEYVLAVKGVVRARPEGTVNPNMPTGKIEVLAHELVTLNDAETPPFHHDEHANEELRLKYRYLDLRREGMLGNLRLRHAVTRAMRNYLDEQWFCRRRNTNADPGDTRRRSRLYRSKSDASGQIFCPAAVTANIQTTSDDVRTRSLLPDCSLLP